MSELTGVLMFLIGGAAGLGVVAFIMSVTTVPDLKDRVEALEQDTID